MTITTAAGGLARRTTLDGHPEWCARGHHCGLGEHRSTPISLRAPGRGVVVLTRVMAADGREHAEVRLRVALAPGPARARAHLARLVSGLDALLTGVTHPPPR